MDRLPEQQSSTSTVTDNVWPPVPGNSQFGGRFEMQDRLLLQPMTSSSRSDRRSLRHCSWTTTDTRHIRGGDDFSLGARAQVNVTARRKQN